MVSALVSDTRSAVWFLSQSSELSNTARSAMRAANDNDQPIYVSAITLVELSYPIEKGRLEEQKIQELLAALNNSTNNFELVPIDLAITQALRKIPRTEVPDMPDSIIAATALHLDLPLVTRDGKIRASTLTTIW